VPVGSGTLKPLSAFLHAIGRHVRWSAAGNVAEVSPWSFRGWIWLQ
jgi:hypothetical protein